MLEKLKDIYIFLASVQISIIDDDDNLPTFSSFGSFEASIKEGSAIGSIVQGLNLFVEDLDKVFHYSKSIKTTALFTFFLLKV